MLDAVIEIVGEIVFGTVGAFAIWAGRGFKGSYSAILHEQRRKSILLGVLIVAVTIGAIFLIAG